jgi:serine/threonine protein kinase
MDIEPKVIGEGTFGCVHHPALRCKEKNISDYQDKISKIMPENEVNEEMNEYIGINEIDPRNKYHLAPEECTPDDSEKMKEYIMNCKKLGKYIIRDLNYDKSYKLILMKYGGPDLKKFFQPNMENTPDNRERISNFWEDALDLFKAVKLFLDNGLIHHDLKPDNFVYNEEKNSLKVIDFGLLKKKEFITQESKNSSYGFSMFWFNFPPEMYFYNKKVYDNIKAFNKSKYNPDDIYERIRVYFRGKNQVDYTESINFLMGFIKSESLHPYIRYDNANYFLDFVDYTVSPEKMSHTEFLKKSIDTIDSYGLGMTLLFVLVRVHHLMEKDLVLELHTLFLKMFHPDLRKRIHINDALREYNKIITPPLHSKNGGTKKKRKHKKRHNKKNKKSIRRHL